MKHIKIKELLKTSPSGQVLSPIISRGRPTEKPGDPFSTMKAEIPANPLCLLVTAKTSSRSAIGALVMKVLEPFST